MLEIMFKALSSSLWFTALPAMYTLAPFLEFLYDPIIMNYLSGDVGLVRASLMLIVPLLLLIVLLGEFFTEFLLDSHFDL
jgi:hypothetical protein